MGNFLITPGGYHLVVGDGLSNFHYKGSDAGGSVSVGRATYADKLTKDGR